MAKRRIYVAIDLKSFYASVECVERGLDPLDANLVVADNSRTEKTICLAVSPSLKSYGVPGRPRLFEVISKVKDINAERAKKAPGGILEGASRYGSELAANPALAVDYYVATPRMALYVEYSTRIYQIYLQYIAPEDIHVYSIDEVFMDVTDYLKTYQLSAHDLAMTMIRDVLKQTGITATAGIGTNMYLAKIAMDIVAKKSMPDRDGVRIASLDEQAYREKLWEHRPLTDFWRVGRGYARKLEAHGMYTMGDVALASVASPFAKRNEELLYKLFGVNAELLIDHAWGYEPVTIKEVKAYRPEAKSVGTGMVLQEPYSYDKARIVVQEMLELLCLDLVEKGLKTNQLVLTIGYDRENLATEEQRMAYHGAVVMDHYGRLIPKHSHGTVNLKHYSSSSFELREALLGLFEQLVDPALTVRRVNIAACKVLYKENVSQEPVAQYEMLDLFSSVEGNQSDAEEQYQAQVEREQNRQEAVLHIRKRFGKNAIMRAISLEEGAVTKQRNGQIGGHKS